MENPNLTRQQEAMGWNEATRLPQNVAQHHSIILLVTLPALLLCKNPGVCTILKFVPGRKGHAKCPWYRSGLCLFL